MRVSTSVRALILCVLALVTLGFSAGPVSAQGSPWRLKVKGSAAAPLVPQLAPTLTLYHGAWSVSGRGGARLSNMTTGLRQNSVTVNSWNVTATGNCGNAAHWSGTGTNIPETATTMTPQLSASGVTNKLTLTSCEFAVVANGDFGSSNTALVTMTPVPCAGSMGSVNGNDNFLGAVVSSSAAGFVACSGPPPRILIARGAERGTAACAGFTATFSFSTYVTVEDADQANKGNTLSCVDFSSVNFMEAKGINATSPAGTGTTYRFRVANSNNVKLTDIQAGSGKTNSYKSGTNGVLISGSTNVTVTNATVLGQDSGFVLTGAVNGVTMNNPRVRWYYNNAFQYDNITNVTINDAVVMSAQRLVVAGNPVPPGVSQLHTDALQINDDASPNTVTWNRAVFLSADSTLGYQLMFAGGGALGNFYNYTNNVVNGCLCLGPSVNGLLFSSNAGTSVLKNLTLGKLATGGDATGNWYPVCITPEGYPPGDGACPYAVGPNLYFSSAFPANWTGTMTVDHAYIYGVVSVNSPAYATIDTPSVKAYSNVACTTCFAVTDPRGDLEAILPPVWEAMTMDNIIALVKSKYAPKPGGPLDMGDGTYASAIKPDGSWQPRRRRGGRRPGRVRLSTRRAPQRKRMARAA